MLFEEYIDRVVGVFFSQQQPRTEAAIFDAVIEGEGLSTHKESDFDRALTKVKNALKTHRALLGVYGPNGEAVEPRDIMRNKNLDPAAMRRYLLKIRHDLNPENSAENSHPDNQTQTGTVTDVIAKVLRDLTKALNIRGLGEVFSREERLKYEAEFGRPEMSSDSNTNTFAPSEPAPEVEPSPATPTPTPQRPDSIRSNAEYEAIVAKLRAEGKIY
jgi:hypothetical protein